MNISDCSTRKSSIRRSRQRSQRAPFICFPGQLGPQLVLPGTPPEQRRPRPLSIGSSKTSHDPLSGSPFYQEGFAVRVAGVSARFRCGPVAHAARVHHCIQRLGYSHVGFVPPRKSVRWVK